MKTITFEIDGHTLEFYQVGLKFYDSDVQDIFAKKNNKTLAQTLIHPRYQHLCEEVYSSYESFLGQELGTFLAILKSSENVFYRRFLNPYGDEIYCAFRIENDLVYRGLYCFRLQGQIQYLGRCRDNFGKRINQGYGRIHPKNCYLDGQATNCHLNALINIYKDNIEFYVCPLEDVAQIEEFERQLIRQLQPTWNIALKAS